MSRIGKLPVNLPDTVTANITGNSVEIKGPKGEMVKSFDASVTVSYNDSDRQITVEPANNTRLARALQGTVRSIISSMVEGVQNPFSKNLVINGVGFRAILQGSLLVLNLGYSHDIKYNVPKGITITIEENTKVKVEGVDKQLVGQVAADIKSYYPVEPYKAKGVTIVGEFVRRKEGKKTA